VYGGVSDGKIDLVIVVVVESERRKANQFRAKDRRDRWLSVTIENIVSKYIYEKFDRQRWSQ
jgi:hypothetical protein